MDSWTWRMWQGIAAQQRATLGHLRTYEGHMLIARAARELAERLERARLYLEVRMSR